MWTVREGTKGIKGYQGEVALYIKGQIRIIGTLERDARLPPKYPEPSSESRPSSTRWLPGSLLGRGIVRAHHTAVCSGLVGVTTMRAGWNEDIDWAISGATKQDGTPLLTRETGGLAGMSGQGICEWCCYRTEHRKRTGKARRDFVEGPSGHDNGGHKSWKPGAHNKVGRDSGVALRTRHPCGPER